MAHTLRNYDHLIGKITGISEKQFRAHFTLYEGYIKKINEIEEKLKTINRVDANYSYNDYSELQRRRAVAFNGAHLHQLYFENLSPTRTQPGAELLAAITRDFGSLKNWVIDMKAALKSADGWVLLTRSRTQESLRNNVIEEHHRGILVEQDILLAIDGWEHAYMVDYGVNKGDYLQVIENSIDWNIASQRYLISQSISKAA